MERTALYRLFNATDELLYVGITWQSLPDRMKGHAGGQSWWQEVHHSTAIWYETREEADWAETEAILSERPKYNIAKTARPQCVPTVRCFAPSGVTDGDEAPTELLLAEGWLQGAPAAHIDQLLSLPGQGVNLGVIPDGTEWKTVPRSSFTLCENYGHRSHVAIDLLHERVQITQGSEVARYRSQYDLLQRSALHGAEAVAFVREVAASLRDGS